MALLLAATWPDTVTFVVAAVICLVGAIGVVVSPNPVHSALSLVMTLFGVAVLFVEENAQFLAAVQVIVYAGAIVVLFLFVIMLLGVDRTEAIATEPLKGQRTIAIVLGVLAFAEVLLLAHGHWPTGAHSTAGTLNQGTTPNVNVLGRSIFTTYLLAFEITSALLVIAIIGAVVLARRPGSAVPSSAAAGSPPEAGPPEGTGDDEAEADGERHDFEEDGDEAEGAAAEPDEEFAVAAGPAGEGSQP